MEYTEGDDSTFTHMGKQYLVDDLISLTNGIAISTLDVSKLDWIFEFATPDEMRIEQASLHYPIIVTKDFVDGKDRYIVIDGLHRLAKAMKMGKKYIRCYIVPKRDMETLKVIKNK